MAMLTQEKKFTSGGMDDAKLKLRITLQCGYVNIYVNPFGLVCGRGDEKIFSPSWELLMTDSQSQVKVSQGDVVMQQLIEQEMSQITLHLK